MLKKIKDPIKRVCVFVVLVLGSAAFIATSPPYYNYTVHVYERELTPIKIVLSEQRPKRTLMFQIDKSWLPDTFDKKETLTDGVFRHYYRIQAKGNESDTNDDVPRFAIRTAQIDDNRQSDLCFGKAKQDQGDCYMPGGLTLELPFGDVWITHSNVSGETAHTHTTGMPYQLPQSFNNTSKLYIELEWLQGPPVTVELDYAAQVVHTYLNDEDGKKSLPDFGKLSMRVSMSRINNK